MSRKSLIIILLTISWPVNNIHRLLNSDKELPGKWFPFRPEYVEDLQWYIHDVCQCLSYLCIFIAIWLYLGLYKRKDENIYLIFSSFLIIQIIDLFHYIGWHRTSEVILSTEGFIFLLTALRMLLKYTHGQAR